MGDEQLSTGEVGRRLCLQYHKIEEEKGCRRAKNKDPGSFLEETSEAFYCMIGGLWGMKRESA